MPRKECSVVEERLRFVARLLDGEAEGECPASSQALDWPVQAAALPRRFKLPGPTRR